MSVCHTNSRLQVLEGLVSRLLGSMRLLQRTLDNIALLDLLLSFFQAVAGETENSSSSCSCGIDQAVVSELAQNVHSSVTNTHCQCMRRQTQWPSWRQDAAPY